MVAMDTLVEVVEVAGLLPELQQVLVLLYHPILLAFTKGLEAIYFVLVVEGPLIQLLKELMVMDCMVLVEVVV